MINQDVKTYDVEMNIRRRWHRLFYDMWLFVCYLKYKKIEETDKKEVVC